MKSVHQQQQALLTTLEKALKRVRESVGQVFTELEVDITFDQWVVLYHISENQGISQIKLCELCAKRPASLTRILVKLTHQELIIKQNNKHNRRANKLYLSPKGVDLKAKLIPIYEKKLKAIFAKTYERELSLVSEVIGRISADDA